MKSYKGIILLTVVLLSALLTYTFVTNLATAATLAEPQTPTAVFPVIADFEGGVPAGWFVYGDWGNVTIDITVPTIADSDPLALPGQVGANDILSVTANVPTWAGFGAAINPVQDWSDYDALSFWFYGANSGALHELEIQTAPGDDRRAEFTDNFTGWRQIILPFSTFGAGGAYDVTQVDNWVFVLDGTIGSFKLDHLQLVNLQPFADFEGGVPAGWFVYGDWGNVTIDITNPTIPDSDPLALPGQVGPNDILSVTANVPTWAGFGAGFNPVQDWSDMQGVSFWFYGENSGTTHEFEIQTAPGDDRRAEFVDNFTGWQLITLPFAAFGAGGAYDVSQVDNWVFVLDGTVGSFKIDHLSVYGDAGNVTLRVQFAEAAYAVTEGDPVTLTVTLNATSTETITVEYATADGTATGSDYVPVSGTLTFLPGALAQQIVIATIDNNSQDGSRDFTVQLANPVNAELGARAVATVTIQDNEAPNPSKMVVIDDFEDGLPSGLDGNGIGIGFVTWGDTWNGTAVAITTTSTSAAAIDPVPGKAETNQVINLESMVVGWGGFTHAFENETVDTWVSQDWRGYEGIAFWYYGTGTGTVVFVDVAENRNPGSTSDDAERWSYEWVDNTAGWQFIAIPFADLTRKDIGNGAPNDGWTGEEVHGWALGTTGTGGSTENRYVDDFGLLVRVTVVDDFENGLPSGTDANGLGIGFVTWGDTWNGTAVAITTTSTLSAGLPAVPGKSDANQVINLESLVVGWGGFTHAFENETVDTWVSQDWSSYEGICFWYYGAGSGTTVFVDVAENRNPGSTSDDAERWSYEWTDDAAGWQLIEISFAALTRKDIGNGAPNDGWTGEEVHGWALGTTGTGGSTENRYVDDFAVYGSIGGAQELRLTFDAARYAVVEGETAVITVTLNMTAAHPVTVAYATAEGYATPERDYTPVSGVLTIPAGELAQTFTVPTLDDAKHEGDENVMLTLSNPVSVTFGFQRRAMLTILDDDPADPALVHDFEGFHSFLDSSGAVNFTITELMAGDANARPGQDTYEQVLTVEYDASSGAAQFTQTFVQAQDWSSYAGLSFWYYGSGSGDTLAVELLDNQITTTADVPASEWALVWNDEFDGAAGTPPNPNVWQHEIGDGTLNGIPGWGNSESEYYTDSTENAALDGSGNLALTMHKLDPATTDLACWYGPCEYTSARLIAADRMEYEYGRIEARIQVPTGGSGLWPAFWMLGTNIGEVGWPDSGEIDIMEYVSRIPNEIFGTIHGPGYSGGASFGSTYDFGEPVANDYHTYAVEWSPDKIDWYVDGILYHSAAPDDVAPNEWVFNHPFYMILNLAIGGNFGGGIDPNIVFPQQMLVDYVRVYQAEDTAERFEATFVDNFTGWRKITLPFADFTRSADQPAGAPDDGLNLTEVWGYGVKLPQGSSGLFHLDRVYLETELPVYRYFFPVVMRP
ncbi:MAG: family 16 glycosylhydrolase [Anaerolinea sp.]|nr:family 16 glycosylhydrolase [Anaerolinea sp.]